MIDLTTYALLRKQITSAVSGVSDVRAEGDELVFVLEDGREVRVAIPATEIRDAVVRDDVLVLTLADDKEVVVDATLTQSGQAADAKATGEAISQLKDDMTAKADKAALTRTDRSLDALWKLNQGISYNFETDAAAAYAKQVPSGSKLADVQSVGGKTVVWNNGTNENAVGEKIVSITSTVLYSSFSINTFKTQFLPNRKYLTIVNFELDTDYTCANGFSYGVGYGNDGHYNTDMRQRIEFKNGITNIQLFTAPSTISYSNPILSVRLWTVPTAMDGTYCIFKSNFIYTIDLTQLFGSGNEPTDISDNRIAWIEQYAAAHPEYNAGELVSADVESVIERGKNMALLQQGSLGLSNNVGGGLGNEFDSTTRLRTNFIPISTGVKYKATYFDNLTIANGIAYDKNKNPIDFSYYPNVNTGIFTVDNDEVKYIRLILRHIDSIDITPDCRFQFEVGETSTQYSPYHENTYAIPSTVRALPGYGWSAGDVYNSIERTDAGWQYVQRVGSVDLGSLMWIKSDRYFYTFYKTGIRVSTGAKNAICATYTQQRGEGIFNQTVDKAYAINDLYLSNEEQICIRDTAYTDGAAFKTAMNGVMLYYELAEPIITDITEDMLEPFDVEGGGAITFENAAQLPVPSSVEYIVSLAEVGA